MLERDPELAPQRLRLPVVVENLAQGPVVQAVVVVTELTRQLFVDGAVARPQIANVHAGQTLQPVVVGLVVLHLLSEELEPVQDLLDHAPLLVVGGLGEFTLELSFRAVHAHGDLQSEGRGEEIRTKEYSKKLTKVNGIEAF